jgi:hypothetical protein
MLLNGKFAMALAAALVLATLYGCSSSSGIKNDRDDALAEVVTANVEIMRLMGELETAQGEAGTNAMEVTRLMGELETAQGEAGTNAMEVTRLMGELETAQGEAGTNAMEVTRLMGELETAQGEAGTNAMEVTRLMTLAYGAEGTPDNPTEDSLQGKLNAQKTAIDKVAAAKESMMAMSLMPKLLTAVEDGAAVPTVDVSYDGGAMAKITDYGDAASAGSSDGYAGFEIVKDDDATSTDTVLVFTNVGTDGPKALIADEGAMDMNTWFDVTDGDDADEAFAKNARASGFPSAPPTGSTTVLLGTAVTSPGSATVDRVEFDGSWRGISGVFVCSLCTTQRLEVSAMLVDDEEVLTVDFLTQNWVFQPTNVKATVDVPDDDYLTFGFWKSLPNADDGTYNFATFFDGAQPLASGTATALEGEAKFVGVAAGKYIVKEGSSFSPVFRPGVFTAKATLTADFGADNEAGTISGSISAFLEGGEPIDGNWGVRLGSVGIGADGTFDSANGGATVDEPATEATIHGVKSMTSQWNGGLYNGGDAVAGEFQASFAEGAANVAGAFGATEE